MNFSLADVVDEDEQKQQVNIQQQSEAKGFQRFRGSGYGLEGAYSKQKRQLFSKLPERYQGTAQYAEIPIGLLLAGVCAFLLRLLSTQLPTAQIAGSIKSFMMYGGTWWMMALMAIPEQYIMWTTTKVGFLPSLSVSVAMYIIAIVYNGFTKKPEKSYNEIPWILGTALYAKFAFGVSQLTVMSLIAVDSLMVLLLRGL